MVVEVAVNVEYPESEIQETVRQAFESQANLARLRRDQFGRLCEEFEKQYGLDSDEFMQRFEAGELGDEADYFDWFAAKRGFDLWDRRYRILVEASA